MVPSLRRSALFAVLFAIPLSIGLSVDASAQGVGAIAGIITDESGAVLPGVTVTLSASVGVIGGNQDTVSNERGEYQFIRLIPGTYSVSAELTGFRRAMQQNVVVNADATARADLRLAVGELSEQMTITAEAPLLDTTSVVNQTVLTRAVLDSIPTGNDIWSIARLTPAVILNKADVGGREMFGASTSYVHGSASTEDQYSIDGMDLNNYDSGTQLNFYFDSFSAQEMNYQTGQTSAEQQKGGVITNLITKTGTNAFHGGVMFSGANTAMESTNVSGALRSQLLAAVPARVLATNPDLKPGGEILHIFDLAGSLAGPIKRDRLWFVMSFKLGEVYTHRLGGYNADGTLLLNDNQMRNSLEKSSWAVTKNSQLHFLHSYVRKGRYHVAGGPNVTEFFDTAASAYNPSTNHLVIGRWTDVLTSRMVVDIAVSSIGGQNRQVPQAEVPSDAIARFDAVTRVNSVAASQYTFTSGRRSNVMASLSYMAGNHDFKAGYQLVYNIFNGGNWSLTNFRAVYRNGVPDSVNTYNTPTPWRRNSRESALFAQDKWRPISKLTLNLGIRFETSYGWLVGPLCQTATTFIAAQCFADINGSPDFKNVVPRLSAVYDVFGNGRSALKFSVNKYLISVGASWANRINPIATKSDTRAWTVCTAGQTSACDLNGDKIPQLNEMGPSSGFNLGNTNRYASDAKQPTVNEMSAEFEQQLFGDMVFSTGYYYRNHRDQVGSANLLVPTASYTPLTVTEATSGRTVTVYNQDANLRGRFDTLWTNRPELDDSFHGVDFSLQKRMSHRWMLMTSVSLGTSDVNIYGTADLNNPNNTFFSRGSSSTDRPRFFKVAGAYQLPHGLEAGGQLQSYVGGPDTTSVLVGANTVRLTQVTQSVVIEKTGDTRLPTLSMVDLNVRKVMNVGRFKMEPRIDVFNVFNASPITQWITQLGPTYHSAIEILGARLIKLGGNVSW